MTLCSCFISVIGGSLFMAVPFYSYQEPKNGNTLTIVVVLVLIIVVVLGGAVSALLFYTPTTLRSSSRSSGLQDPSVTSATLTCTGSCNLTGQFYSDYTSQSGPISSTKSAIWMLERPSNTIYWDIEWRISLTSPGTITIKLNTGFVVLQLQGPTSNQGSWTTSTGQY